MGRLNRDDSSESFNITYLAIRESGLVNGVSRLHGKVSRHLFENLFPRWPKDEVPIGHVTNGVHMPGWDAEIADTIWTDTCGKNRWKGELENLEEKINSLSDETLWQMRNQCRNNLVVFTRNRLEAQLGVSEQPPEIVDIAKHVFNSYTLTPGFTRRFVPCKKTKPFIAQSPKIYPHTYQSRTYGSIGNCRQGSSI